MEPTTFDKHVDALAAPEDERRKLRAALGPAIAAGAAYRAAFVLPLDGLMAKEGPTLLDRYREYVATLPPLPGIFSWVDVGSFTLRWAAAGALAFPDLPIRDALAELTVKHVQELAQISTFQMFKLSADNDPGLFVRQGLQSLTLFQNFGVADVGGVGTNWLEVHYSEIHWPAMEYVNWCYNAGIFALFDVDGVQENYDEGPTSFSQRLSWRRR